MKILLPKFSILILLTALVSISSSAQSESKHINLFDFDWRFHRGGALGAEVPAFDDSKWRVVDIPHDWSIEDLPGTNSPFNADAISQVNGGFTTGGTGWYRKTFTIPDGLKDKQFILMFVFQVSGYGKCFSVPASATRGGTRFTWLIASLLKGEFVPGRSSILQS